MSENWEEVLRTATEHAARAKGMDIDFMAPELIAEALPSTQARAVLRAICEHYDKRLEEMREEQRHLKTWAGRLASRMMDLEQGPRGLQPYD